jgi:hypothetical protein
MYQATSGFISALRWPNALIDVQLNVLSGGSPTSLYFPVSDAQFTYDRNSEQRRSGQITVQIPPNIPPTDVTFNGSTVPYLPIDPTSPLAPFGSEVQPSISLLAPDLSQGSVQGVNGWVPLGTYVIATSVIQASAISVVCTLTLYDRSWPFSQWQLLQNYNYPAAGGGLEAEVIALLTYVWNNNGPGQTGEPVPSYITGGSFQGNNSGWSAPAGTLNQSQDPWAACQQWATSAGQELYFDVNGLLTCKPIPGSPAGGKLNALPVVWGFNPNEVSAVGTLQHPLGGTPFTSPVATQLTMTRAIQNAFYVSATGAQNITATATPIMSVAQDTNPQSPTYFQGPIGQIPSFVWDSNITTAAQALAEAQYDLGVSVAGAWTLGVSAPPNPLFDIDDVISVTDPRFNLSGQKVILDTITTSIRYDATMMLTGRVIAAGA